MFHRSSKLGISFDFFLYSLLSSVKGHKLGGLMFVSFYLRV
jgi:hypothetical protein